MLFQLLLQITPKIIHITEVIGIYSYCVKRSLDSRAELHDET